jgi:predicted porin
MQKKLIVLAIAAMASTSAFAETTVYGVADATVASLSGSGVASTTQVQAGGLATSRLGVKATEDLGNGLTAIAVLEYALTLNTSGQDSIYAPHTGATGTTANSASATGNNTGAATGSTTYSAAASVTNNFSARQQMVGLAGSFGTVAAGYLQTASYDWGAKYDVVGGSSISALQNVTYSTSNTFLLGAKGAAVRANNAIAYLSPDISGFSFGVNYSSALAYTDINLSNSTVVNATTGATANTVGSVDITAVLANAAYNAGPLSVDVVYAGTSAPTGLAGAGLNASNNTEYGVGATYDLTVVKLYGTYQSNKNNSQATGATPGQALKNTAYSVGAALPVGSDTVALSYAANSVQTGGASATAAVVSHSNTAYTVGYLHPFSKTTTGYAAYSAVNNASDSKSWSVDNSAIASNSTYGASSSMVAVGLLKKF